MRAFALALVIGVMSLGGLALTPTRTDAQEWPSNGDTIAVRWHGGYGRGWHGGSHYRGWYGGSHYQGWYGGYYAPYYGNYYTPYYNAYPSYYYAPGYNYYSPYYYGSGYYGPRVSVHIGW